MTKNYSNCPDIEIWREFKNGSMEAFAYVYNQYIYKLYHYGDRITSDKEMTEDCIQDLFIELWRCRTNLNDTDSIKYYLFKCLRRKLIKRLVVHRKLSSNLPLTDDYNFEIVFSPEFHLISSQISQFQKDTLIKALQSLTKRQKEAITLKFYDGLSYQEVASIMSLSVKATYNLIYKAIDVLKTNVSKSTFYFLLSLL